MYSYMLLILTKWTITRVVCYCCTLLQYCILCLYEITFKMWADTGLGTATPCKKHLRLRVFQLSALLAACVFHCCKILLMSSQQKKGSDYQTSLASRFNVRNLEMKTTNSTPLKVKLHFPCKILTLKYSL